MYTVCISPEYTSSVLSDLYQKEFFEDVSNCYQDIISAFEPKEDLKTMIERYEEELFEEKFGKKDSDDKSDKKDRKPADSKQKSTNSSAPQGESHSGLNGIAASIGKMIKTLIEKIKGMFDKIFGNLSSEDKKYKTAVDKVNEELKDNPSLKSQIIKGLEQGLISPDAINSMTKLDSDFNTLIKDKNPKSFREKLKKWKDEVTDCDSKFHKTVKALTATAGIGSTIAGVIALGPNISKSMNTAKEQSKRDQEELAKINDDLEAAGEDPDTLNFLKEKIMAYEYKHGKMSEYYAILNKDYSLLNKILETVLRYAEAHPADATKKTSQFTKAAYVKSVSDYEDAKKKREDIEHENQQADAAEEANREAIANRGGDIPPTKNGKISGKSEYEIQLDKDDQAKSVRDSKATSARNDEIASRNKRDRYHNKLNK